MVSRLGGLCVDRNQPQDRVASMKRTHVLAPHYQFVLIKYVNSFRVLRFSPEKNCLRPHYHIKRECLMSFGRRVAPHDYFRGLFQLIAKNTDVPVPKSVGVPVKYGPQLIHRRNSKKSPWIPNCGWMWKSSLLSFLQHSGHSRRC